RLSSGPEDPTPRLARCRRSPRGGSCPGHGRFEPRRAPRERSGQRDSGAMTILTVAVKYLQGRLLASILTAVSIALGVGLVIASVILVRGIKDGFVAGATDYNLVIGAKGSPAQLVLGVVFRMDLATPNIEYTIYQDLQRDPRVEAAVPVALG